MKLTLIRKIFTDDFTVGELYVDDCFFCETIEDKVRELKKAEDKVPSKTAIPYGIYKIIISWSKRFKKFMLELLGVQYFSGVRIHSGNTAEDSQGCIIVGKYYKDGTVINSRNTMSSLFSKVKDAIDKNEEVTIEIKEDE